jgi:hypothetical protein
MSSNKTDIININTNADNLELDAFLNTSIKMNDIVKNIEDIEEIQIVLYDEQSKKSNNYKRSERIDISHNIRNDQPPYTTNTNGSNLVSDSDSESLSTYSSDISELSFSEEESCHILENAITIIKDIINTNPMIYMYPNYKEHITDEVYDILDAQLNHLYLDSNIENELQNIIEDAFKIIHKHYIPVRSFKKTFIRN